MPEARSIAWGRHAGAVGSTDRRERVVVCNDGEERDEITLIVNGRARPARLFGLRVAAGGVAGLPLVEARCGDRSVVVAALDGRVVRVAFDLWAWERALLDESWISRVQPRYTQLPVPYQLIPFRVRAALLRGGALARSALGARPVFPNWPTDTTFDEVVTTLLGALSESAGITQMGSHGRPALLTHDLDSIEGFAGVELLRRAERPFGYRSAFGILSGRYVAPLAMLRGLLEEGCELFSHGYLHDGLLPWLSAPEMDARLRKVREVYAPIADEFRGFRSPQLGRTPLLFERVAAQFDYDLTPPTVEYFGVHGVTSGCATTVPFVGSSGLLHIPVTTPQDFYAMYVLGHGVEQVVEQWMVAARAAWAVGGVATFIVHPDNVVRTPALRVAYQRLLEQLKAARADVTTPGEFARSVGRDPAAARRRNPLQS